MIKLQELLGVKAEPNGKTDLPRLAAKFWEEYSGKQTSLRSFFTRRTPTTSSSTPEPLNTLGLNNTQESSNLSSSVQQPPTLSNKSPTSSPTPMLLSITVTPRTPKRKFTTEKSAAQPVLKKLKSPEKKKGKSDPDQAKISSFFYEPTSSQLSSSSDKPVTSQSLTNEDDVTEIFLHNETTGSSQGSGQTNGDDVKQVWSKLLAPVQPPNCTIHGEPAKEYTVNKPGSNKGKKFFLCSR